jgi:hypothetical protein
MDIAITDAILFQSKIDEEKNYLLKIISEAPVGLKEELSILYGKRKVEFESLNLELTKVILQAPESVSRFIEAKPIEEVNVIRETL